MRYCQTCSRQFEGDGPPFTVLHQATTSVHLDPLTRKPATALDREERLLDLRELERSHG